MKDRKRLDVTRLKNIENKNIFTTPEGYFDKLPDRIQSRISEENKKTRQLWMNTSVRYAVAAAVILLIAWFGIFRTPHESGETADYNQLLSEVTTAELVAYIESTDLTTEEILDEVNLDEQSFDRVFESENEFLEDIYSEEELLMEIDEYI